MTPTLAISLGKLRCEDDGGEWRNDECHYSIWHRTSEWLDQGTHVALVAVILAAILIAIAIWVFRPRRDSKQ